MSLRDLANKGLAGFDPNKDSVDAPQGLPAGKYSTTVSAIEHRSFDSGWDCFGSTFEVVEEDHAGQKENVNISFAETSSKGKAIPDFILDRNIKFVSKLGAFLGVDITADDFAGDNETDVHEHLAKKLHDHIGVMVTLVVTTRPNKKDPSNPYTSYDLEAMEQPEEIDIDDDDLPDGLQNSEPAEPSEAPATSNEGTPLPTDADAPESKPEDNKVDDSEDGFPF